MNKSYPQPNSTTSIDSLDTSNPSKAKSRLKKLSMNENKQDVGNKSHDQWPTASQTSSEKQREDLNQESLYNFEENKTENIGRHNKKRQQIIRRNFQTALEEEEQFGAIKKKVKALSDSETKTSSPTLSRRESDKDTENNSEKKVSKENKFSLNVAQSSTNERNTLETSNPSHQNKEQPEKIRIKCKNLSLFYSEDKRDILFKIEYIDDKTNQIQEKLLTRKQMVESNPLAALYYYENHLQFADNPDFRPKFLQ